MAVANPQIIGTNTYESVVEGNVQNYYMQTMNSIIPTDAVKGTYKYTRASAYNSGNPVNSNTYTTLQLTQNGNSVVHVPNTFISTTVFVEVNLTKFIQQQQSDPEYNRIALDQMLFIGWKSSIDAIQRYDLLCNSQAVYTQNFVGEESFIQYQTLTDLVKHTTPYTYTSYENASQMNPCVCGKYVLLKSQTFNQIGKSPNDEIKTITVRIPIKIPLSSFSILQNIKYLHSWFGRWELRLFFAPQNMVILPINPSNVLRWWLSYITDPDVQVPETYWMTDGKQVNPKLAFVQSYTIQQIASDFDTYPEVHMWEQEPIASNIDLRWRGGNRFIQFGDPIPIAYHFDATRYQEGIWSETTFNLVKMECYDVEIIYACFQLRSDINMSLKQQFLSGQPLTYLVNVFMISRFTGLPTMGSECDPEHPQDFSMTLDQTLNNVNTMFILPFNSHYQHTVCYQPYVKNFQLLMGEFGIYPLIAMNTFPTGDQLPNYIMFNNYVQDALNYNSSRLFSFTDQMSYQFNGNTYVNRSNSKDGKPRSYLETTGVPTNKGRCNTMDDSNFFIPMTFSTENDFQGGLSSPTINVNIKVNGQFAPPKKMKFSTPWVCGFLVDGELMLRPDPASDGAKVIFSIRSLSE
jgi:hypothetical protein